MPDCCNFREWHPTFSVTLGQLSADEWFRWDNELFAWDAFAYSEEQYERVCEAFMQRFWYREISMLPPGKWARRLMYKIRYELCPKYNRLYEAMEDANILQISDKYGKSRDIGSDYPETLLSDNSVYLSDGRDKEYEDIELGSVSDIVPDYIKNWRDIDAAFLDELECMFASVITYNINI